MVVCSVQTLERNGRGNSANLLPEYQFETIVLYLVDCQRHDPVVSIQGSTIRRLEL